MKEFKIEKKRRCTERRLKAEKKNIKMSHKNNGRLCFLFNCILVCFSSLSQFVFPRFGPISPTTFPSLSVSDNLSQA